MKAALVLVTALTCATGGPVQVRTLSAGGNPANSVESAMATPAFDAESYRAAWTKYVGSDSPPPSVDFAKEAVVFLFAGQRNTGGYSIDVRGAALENDTLIIDAVVNGPPPGAMVTQVITYPYAVIAVTPRGFKSVQWNEAKKTGRER